MFKLGLALISLISFAFATGDAMFGLQWGMSPSQIKAMGINIVQKSVNGRIYVYATDSLPKNSSNAEGYHLIFEGDTALVKITMVSSDVTDDSYGLKGKERFESIKKVLAEKYTKMSDFQNVGNKLYTEPDEFYQCLQYDGCGMWVSFFKSENKIVAVKLLPSSRSSGFIQLTVEAVPEFSNLVDRIKADKAKTDSEAF